MPFFDHYPYTNFHNVNLDWVLQAVKVWGQLVEQNNIAFHNLEEANEDFKNFVTSYIENLDVQEEINNKLDSMLESGVLTEYMQPYISQATSTWLDENITQPVGVVIDSSLTVAGACADSEATGKALAIPDGTIISGLFNINTTDRILEIIERATITDGKNKRYFFIEPQTITFATGNYANFTHLVYYRISTNTIIFFVPSAGWEHYAEINPLLTNNPRDFVYLFSADCKTYSAKFLGISVNSHNFTVNGYYQSGCAISRFDYFTSRYRIYPYVFIINFTSLTSFVVDTLIIPNKDTGTFSQLPNNYTVDWSDRTNPTWIKLVLLNKNTNILEIADKYESSLNSNYYYIGYVYYGVIGDVIFTNQANITGNGTGYINTFGVLSTTYREIFRNGNDLFKLPLKVGVAGDSLSVGYMKDKSGTVHRRNLAFSWVKQISKDSNNPWLNIGQSGQTVLTWCSDSTYGKAQLEASGNKCQMYIIGLGVNDASLSVPVGTISDIVNNPDTVATTYYGGFARIIKLMKRVNSQCVILCLTNPRETDRTKPYNDAIRDICNNYYANDNTVLLLDMVSMKELFTSNNSPLYQDNQRTQAGGHYTIYGYRMIANVMEYKLNRFMLNNRDTFENMPFIPYDTSDPTPNTMIE